LFDNVRKRASRQYDIVAIIDMFDVAHCERGGGGKGGIRHQETMAPDDGQDAAVVVGRGLNS